MGFQLTTITGSKRRWEIRRRGRFLGTEPLAIHKLANLVGSFPNVLSAPVARDLAAVINVH